MKTHRFLLSAALLLSTTILARADRDGLRLPPLTKADILAKYDTNGDGKISSAERAAMNADLAAQRKALIAKYDTNGDGVLNAAERAAMQADLQAQHLAEQTAQFTALDTDSSGGLSLAEFTIGAPTGSTPAQILASFNRLDTDGDGSVSLAEFTATEEQREAAKHLAQATARFKALDTDASGDLSLAEFTVTAPKRSSAAKILARFTALDTDKSGSLSLAEFTVAKAEIEGGHR